MSTEHATRTTTSGRDAVLLRQIAVVIAVERMVPTLVGGIDFSDRWIFLGLHIDDGAAQRPASLQKGDEWASMWSCTVQGHAGSTCSSSSHASLR